MARTKRRETAEWQWEQALIDAYHDYRWRAVFDALHERLHCWERGELTHDEMDNEVHKAHKETQAVYRFLSAPKRDELILYIGYDTEWFEPWLATHPAPQGIDLSQVRLFRQIFVREDRGEKRAEESE